MEDAENRVVFTVFGWDARRGKAQFKLGSTWIHTFDLVSAGIGTLVLMLACAAVCRKRRLRQAAFTSGTTAPRPSTAEDPKLVIVGQNPMAQHPSRDCGSPELEAGSNNNGDTSWRIVTVDHTAGGAESSTRSGTPTALVDSRALTLSSASSMGSMVAPMGAPCGPHGETWGPRASSQAYPPWDPWVPMGDPWGTHGPHGGPKGAPRGWSGLRRRSSTLGRKRKWRHTHPREP